MILTLWAELREYLTARSPISMRWISGYLRRVGTGKPAATFPSQRFHALYQRVNFLRDNLTTQPIERTAAQLDELAGEILNAYTSEGTDDGGN